MQEGVYRKWKCSDDSLARIERTKSDHFYIVVQPLVSMAIKEKLLFEGK